MSLRRRQAQAGEGPLGSRVHEFHVVACLFGAAVNMVPKVAEFLGHLMPFIFNSLDSSF